LAWLARDTRALVRDTPWPAFKAGDKISTRKASQACLKAIAQTAPWFIGGSADLAGSNATETGKPLFTATTFAGAQTLACGVREHAMGAISNGMALHGGVLPYCATFLVFHDYMRPAVRLSCVMEQPVIYIYTHDSVFLGEDGPTHQPVETLLALRAIPRMRVVRPADAAETAEAWKLALNRQDGPTAIVLTRQNLLVLDRAEIGAVEGAQRGAYVVLDVPGAPDAVVIATGSEVAPAIAAARMLREQGLLVRVVSAPCRELFKAQDAAYREAVLPPGVPRASVEAGVTLGWEGYVGDSGLSLGIDRFGASAPDTVLAEEFGLSPARIAASLKTWLKR
jgi:transketolase